MVFLRLPFIYIATKELYFNVLITFSCSIGVIYLIQDGSVFKSAVAVAFIYLITHLIEIDYGFWGIMLPVFPTIVEKFKKFEKNEILFFQPQFYSFAVGMIMVVLDYGGNQPFSVLALIFLGLYNGNLGFHIPKYSFYIFYPLHIALIWLIDLILS